MVQSKHGGEEGKQASQQEGGPQRAPEGNEPAIAPAKSPSPTALEALARQLPAWAQALGFSQIGVADVDLRSAEPGLQAWLEAGFHGSMAYMARHGLTRARPAELVPGTVRVITARMDYLPASSLMPESASAPDWRAQALAAQTRPGEAVLSFYARGRDYHKVLRQRLQSLAEQLAVAIGPLGYRVFTDSAPVLEVELAQRSGLGWRGKHTLLLSRQAGSMFFLGEIFVDVPLPLTPPVPAHCGECEACIQVCPTQAIVAPGRLDARRCISYLTIEHAGPIPEDLRPALGSRVYGCDDCQLACPWNKFAQPAQVADFQPRAVWPSSAGAAPAAQPVLPWEQLWAWDEATFLRHTEGSPVRRIGYQRWRRNLAVVGGNALAGWAAQDVGAGTDAGLGGQAAAQRVRQALGQAWAQASSGPQTDALVAEHLAWALRQGVA